MIDQRFSPSAAAGNANASAKNSIGKKGGKRKKAPKPVSKKSIKRQSEEQELADLEERTQDPTVYTSNPDLKLFSQLPLSSNCQEGLKKGNFIEMTEIQKSSLPYTLCGRDVLGAAKTGSGKTLAFLVPVLETLFRAKWTSLDGVGALIISPTRELALQIFEVLKKVGRFYSFSAGLLIGGKDLATEQDRVNRMNILVCTPGRLLQHMDQTPDFNCDNLQILVLDEADRILDSGFEKALNAIIANLPKVRQTLLFSATQTKSVKDLARLSLKDPEYVAVHEQSDSATPQNLTQKYVTIELNQKLDMLYSFLKTHLKQKIIVFVSSCKQTRFVYETFCKLHPGIPLMHLFGKQKQPKRLAIFESFCRKTSVCLISTDLAARGLDFPAVDWVIQLDCPENVDTYIHRVGRTARYDAKGNALLFLTPSEKPGMIEALTKKKIPIEEIKVNPKKIRSVQQQMVMFCSRDPEIKYLAQKAFISYMRSVYLQSEKSIFDVHALPAEAFAESMGLPGAPKIKFVQKKNAKNDVRQKQTYEGEEEEEKKDAKKMAKAKDGKVKGKIEVAESDEEEGGVDEEGDAVEEEGDADDNNDEDEEEVDEPAADKKGVKKVVIEDDEEKPVKDANKVITKVDRMFQAKNRTIFSEHYQKLVEDENAGAEDDDGFFGLVRRDHDVEEVEKPQFPEAAPSKKQLLKAKQKELAKRGMAKKTEFDEEGNPILFSLETMEEFEAKESIEERRLRHLQEQQLGMKVADAEDKNIAKEKRRMKRLAEKLKAKGDGGETEAVAILAGGSDEEDDGGDYGGEDGGDDGMEFDDEEDDDGDQDQYEDDNEDDDDDQPIEFDMDMNEDDDEDNGNREFGGDNDDDDEPRDGDDSGWQSDEALSDGRDFDDDENAILDIDLDEDDDDVVPPPPPPKPVAGKKHKRGEESVGKNVQQQPQQQRKKMKLDGSNLENIAASLLRKK
ncbi:ATP-dependent RNA helicase dbp4 [Blyttiomyces sp. JEL0837]|nr:ATP-dependent RNA helicase dbp4 [Blyttiomyces sp. JEL0837]